MTKAEKKAIVESMSLDEQRYLQSKSDIDVNQKTLINYNKNIKNAIIDKMRFLGIDKLNKVKLVEKPILKEITISQLKEVISEKLLDNVCVTVDLEATRNSLIVNCGMSNIVVEEILNNIKRIETNKIFDLEEI